MSVSLIWKATVIVQCTRTLMWKYFLMLHVSLWFRITAKWPILSGERGSPLNSSWTVQKSWRQSSGPRKDEGMRSVWEREFLSCSLNLCVYTYSMYLTDYSFQKARPGYYLLKMYWVQNTWNLWTTLCMCYKDKLKHDFVNVWLMFMSLETDVIR